MARPDVYIKDPEAIRFPGSIIQPSEHSRKPEHQPHEMYAQMKVKLKSQSIDIQAKRTEVFKLISSFGDAEESDGSSPPTNNDQEGKTIIERDGNRLLMEFRSRDGRKMYRTLEEVMLYPEERITFRHIEGPLNHSEEEFVFVEHNSGTTMTHRGEIECRMHWLPFVGWLVARFYVKRHYERLVLRHMNGLKESAEGSQDNQS